MQHDVRQRHAGHRGVRRGLHSSGSTWCWNVRDSHGDTDHHADEYTDEYADEYPDIDADQYADQYADQHADADEHAHDHADVHAHLDTDADGNADANADHHGDADTGAVRERRRQPGLSRRDRQRQQRADRLPRSGMRQHPAVRHRRPDDVTAHDARAGRRPGYRWAARLGPVAAQ